MVISYCLEGTPKIKLAFWETTLTYYVAVGQAFTYWTSVSLSVK